MTNRIEGALRHGMALVVSAVLALTAAGCWDRHELEELGFVTVMGIDKGEKGKVKLTLQIPLPSKVGGSSQGGGGGGGGPTFLTSSIESESISEAIYKVMTFQDRRPNFLHTKFIIIGKDYAEDVGLGGLLGFLTRFREIRRTSYMAVSTAKAEDIVKIQPEEEKNPIDYYTNLWNLIKSSAAAAPISIHQAAIAASPYATLVPAIPIIGPKDGGLGGQKPSPPKEAMLSGMAVFNRERMTGRLNDYETQGYLFLSGQFARGAIPVKLKDGRAILAVREAHRTVKYNGSLVRPRFDVMIEVDADIVGLDSNQNYTTDRGMDLLGDLLAQEIKRRCDACLKVALDEEGADIFDFGRLVRQHVPILRWIEYDWKNRFKDSTVTVRAKARIRRTGNAFEPLVAPIVEK